MQDIFTQRVSNQITFLEGAFVSFSKRLAMQEVAKKATWLFMTPVLGPFVNLLIGRWVGKVLSWLAHNAEFQAYFENSRRRYDAQAERFDKLVEARANATTPEELKRAEDLANKSFDDVVKFSS